MTDIHSTAIVSSKAKLGENVKVAPYAIIHDDVEIGDDCSIGPHAVIYDGARIGNRVKVHQSASVAHFPQDIHFDGSPTNFIIGDDTIIHEFVTLHRGTNVTGKSSVGKKCLLMAYSHIAHDCTVGDNVILANSVQVGGHVTIEDFTFIGGSTPVHQFCLVGAHSIIGGGLRITQDVPPFIMSAGEPLRFSGLNLIGLRRRGFSNDDIFTLKKAYNFIYDKSLNVSQAKEKIKEEIGTENKHVNYMLDFFDRSKRGIVGK